MTIQSEKDQAIARAISTPAGRQLLAQAMLNGMRRSPECECLGCGAKWRDGPHPMNQCELREIWDVMMP